jgi:immune inhibitor A
MSNRTYTSFDRYLQTGPYNFGFPDRPDFVEHFPYQQGLLISYWDTSQPDNNTSEHPGQGLILPIDAHPDPLFNLTGQPWRARIQVYDAPFSLQRADTFTLHVQGDGRASLVRGQPAVPTFDDSRQYFFPELQTPANMSGVDVPDTGTRIKVVRQDGTSMRIRITTAAPGA